MTTIVSDRIRSPDLVGSGAGLDARLDCDDLCGLVQTAWIYLRTERINA